MSGIERRIRRLGDIEPSVPQFKLDGAGGYSALHPRKGWRHFSAKRIAAIRLTEAKKRGDAPWWRGVPAMEQVALNG